MSSQQQRPTAATDACVFLNRPNPGCQTARRARLAALAAVTLGATFLVLNLPDACLAQSGMFGSRNLGGGTLSPRQNNFGGQGAFGGRTGLGGGMGGGMGGGGMGAGGFGMQGAGQVDGTERFVRGARQPGQFVGADSGDTQNIYSQSGMAGGANQFGQMNRGLGGMGMNQFGMQNQFGMGGQYGAANRGRNTRQTGQRGQFGGQFGAANRQMQQGALPRRLSASMIARTVPPPVADANVQQRIERMSQPTQNASSTTRRLPAISPAASVQVSMEGQTAVLRGTVTSEYEKALVARMARLEPGIWAVRNEVTIVSPPAGPNAESLPTPAAR